MPTYLCHGFRWQRRSIRVYVVVQNLDDGAPEWIVRRGSARTLLESFYNLFDFLPECTAPRTTSSVRGSNTALRSYSISQSVENSAESEDELYNAHHSSRSRSRSVSRSQHQLHHQQQQQLCDQSVPLRKDNSNSSKKPSKSENRRKMSTNSSTNLPLNHNHNHQTPPSPPSSQSHEPPSISDNDTNDDVLAQSWSPVKLVEEFDPKNLEEVSRPYAYVADYVRRIDMSCSIIDEIARYEALARASNDPAVTGASSDEKLQPNQHGKRKRGWFEKLRDELQRGEDIRWYVVVNGDEEREWPDEAVGKTTAAEIDRERESRAQVAHHAQYTHQQLLFENGDKEHEIEREKLRREMGYESGGIDRLMEKRVNRKPPPKDLPPPLTLRTKMSMDQGLRPKTPKTGRFRSFFGRNKADEMP